MRKLLLSLSLAIVAGGAQAQIKCWNEGGKRVCGDAPPAGAKVTTLQTPAAPPPQPAAASKDGKSASKGPLTPAEQEAAFRKRQAEASKNAEKSAQAEREAAEKADNCARARASIQQMESGQRVARTDARGERYFLDEAAVAKEIARAREVASKTCG
jgi:hypothetical protein